MNLLNQIREAGAAIRLVDGQIGLKGGGAAALTIVKANKAVVIAELKAEESRALADYAKLDEILDNAYYYRRNGIHVNYCQELIDLLDNAIEVVLVDYPRFIKNRWRMAAEVIGLVRVITGLDTMLEGNALATHAHQVFYQPPAKEPKKNAFAARASG